MNKIDVTRIAKQAFIIGTSENDVAPPVAKFAELIVQECIDEINAINIVDAIADENGPALIQATSAIKMRDRIIAVLRNQLEQVEG